jgi:decaprenylphospho-beta-D-erythro-pentofuranosid-2-ulose 2-reductase
MGELRRAHRSEILIIVLAAGDVVRIAIIGATSAIAQAAAANFAEEHATLFLVARDPARLAAVAADLRARGASDVEELVADLGDLSRHEAIVSAAGDVDAVLIAYGSLPDQRAIDRDPMAQIEAFQLNATSVISIAARFANLLETRKGGTLAVIGSVAGDRGRRSNYLYGAAKAAIHTWCGGVRGRLAEAGANVLLIKPGWVDTPMTRDIKKNPLFAEPRAVGRAIHDAIVAKKQVVYLPGFWRWISLIVRMLPARLVKF